MLRLVLVLVSVSLGRSVTAPLDLGTAAGFAIISQYAERAPPGTAFSRIIASHKLAPDTQGAPRPAWHHRGSSRAASLHLTTCSPPLDQDGHLHGAALSDHRQYRRLANRGRRHDRLYADSCFGRLLHVDASGRLLLRG